VMATRILFCRIAWLRDYCGPEETISGAGSERDSRHDWESFNFAPHGGLVYGYVASSGHRTVEVSKLGALGDIARDVLVVWVSLHPSEGRQRVVGWYKNATVHRHLQQSPPMRECTSASGERVEYHIEATEYGAFLLRPEERKFTVPKGSGFMGQSNVCFMRSPEATNLVANVVKYINEHSAAVHKNVPPEQNFPESALPGRRYAEGAVQRVAVNAYERNAAARALCVAHWGTRCVVCSLSFEEMYGETGRGFIHVHHVVPLASVPAGYEVDPLRDLVPVCPNCHAMLHTSDPPLSVEELRKNLIKPLGGPDRSRAPSPPCHGRTLQPDP
jgi:hypothetical protein